MAASTLEGLLQETLPQLRRKVEELRGPAPDQNEDEDEDKDDASAEVDKETTTAEATSGNDTSLNDAAADTNNDDAAANVVTGDDSDKPTSSSSDGASKVDDAAQTPAEQVQPTPLRGLTTPRSSFTRSPRMSTGSTSNDDAIEEIREELLRQLERVRAIANVCMLCGCTVVDDWLVTHLRV